MTKLKLDLDRLSVETFATVTTADDGGTVHAYQVATKPYSACFTCATCVGVTCP